MSLRGIYSSVPGLIGLDLFSKWLVEGIHGGVMTLIQPWLTLRVIHNQGGFLGFPFVFGGLAIVWIVYLVAMGALLALAWSIPPAKKGAHFGCALMIAGGSSNIISRLAFGYVCDFVQIGPIPIFNLADVMLVLGLMVIMAFGPFSKPVRKDLT